VKRVGTGGQSWTGRVVSRPVIKSFEIEIYVIFSSFSRWASF
jgi:hypothetical protein